MLNELQAKQFTAFNHELQNDSDEISPELAAAYFCEFQPVDFIRKAIKYGDRRENGVISGVMYPQSPVLFYESNRDNIIDWFEAYTANVGHESVVDYIRDLANETDIEVNIDGVGRIVYGNDTHHVYYNHVAERLTMFVAENLAALFYKVADSLEGEPMELEVDKVDCFMTVVAKGNCNKVSKQLADDFLRNMGSEIFGTSSVNGAATHSNPVGFFKEHRENLIDWIDSITLVNSTKHRTCLDYIETLINDKRNDLSIGYVSVDNIAKIIFGNDESNPHYKTVAKSLTDFLGETLAKGYQNFLEYDYDDLLESA